ncbi:MAG: polysaccharide deacetylase family protein [Armatimonadetes bacterium]|nr:polysaccharide deacetylase family protein [Armatimonadota bacterium]
MSDNERTEPGGDEPAVQPDTPEAPASQPATDAPSASPPTEPEAEAEPAGAPDWAPAAAESAPIVLPAAVQPIERRYRPEPRPSGLRWSRVLGILLAAMAVGTAGGLSVPIEGRSGWSWLFSGDVGLPVVFPWQKVGPVEPGVVAWVNDRGAFTPPSSRFRVGQLRSVGTYGLLAAANYDRPPASALRRTWLPAAGDDPASLSRNGMRALLDTLLEPAEIAQVAREAFVPIIMYHDVVEGAKLVSFDLTAQEFDAQLDKIAAAGCTPISLRQWWNYITRGDSLPEKPIMLTFDDGYENCYKTVFPRLKKRGWPGVFFIVPGTIGKQIWSKGHVSWAQCREMMASGLCEIQSHSLTHPDLTKISPAQLKDELVKSRASLEKWLGRPVQFFCYPMGRYDERVVEATRQAGYVAAFLITKGGSAQSRSIMEVDRFNELNLDEAIARSDAGPLREVKQATQAVQAAPPPVIGQARDYGPVTFHQSDLAVGGQKVPMVWITGGKPVTVHCDFRYAVGDVAKLAGAAAGINGSFFQLARVKDISNAMLGPVMSQLTTKRDVQAWRTKQLALPESLLAYNQYIPGEPQDIVRLIGRPYVLIGASGIKFVEFQTAANSLTAARQLQPDLTDAFVAGGWLVRDGVALTKDQLDKAATRDHNDFRRRAWFGVNRDGVPMIGACPSSQRSEIIARAIVECGVRTGVLLDSGFSSSLIFRDEVYVTGHSDAQPSRTVPHMILLTGAVDEAAAAQANPPDLRSMGSDPGAASTSRRRRRR